MRAFHVVLLLPVVALLGTPFFPFVNSATPWFGLPSVVVWVCAWCVLTSLLLAWVLRREERAGLIGDDDPGEAEAAGGEGSDADPLDSQPDPARPAVDGAGDSAGPEGRA